MLNKEIAYSALTQSTDFLSELHFASVISLDTQVFLVRNKQGMDTGLGGVGNWLQLTELPKLNSLDG